MRKSSSIALGAKNGDIVIRRAECLHSFVGLLTIVECWCHAMETKVWICNKLRRAPFASLDAVVRLDMAIDCTELAQCGV